jgi:hypothetical protein
VVNIGKLTKRAKQAKGALEKHGDKVAAGIEKATDLVDKQTKGKHRAKLDKVNELAAKLDKTKPSAPAAEPPPPPPPAPATGPDAPGVAT